MPDSTSIAIVAAAVAAAIVSNIPAGKRGGTSLRQPSAGSGRFGHRHPAWEAREAMQETRDRCRPAAPDAPRR